jgi:hypothetical protein
MFTRWKKTNLKRIKQQNKIFVFFFSLRPAGLLLGGKKEKKEGGPLIECPNSMCEHVRACVMSRSSALCRHFVVGTMTGCPALRDSSFSYVCAVVDWSVCVCVCVCVMCVKCYDTEKNSFAREKVINIPPWRSRIAPTLCHQKKKKSQKEMKKKKDKNSLVPLWLLFAVVVRSTTTNNRA